MKIKRFNENIEDNPFTVGMSKWAAGDNSGDEENEDKYSNLWEAPQSCFFSDIFYNIESDLEAITEEESEKYLMDVINFCKKKLEEKDKK